VKRLLGLIEYRDTPMGNVVGFGQMKSAMEEDAVVVVVAESVCGFEIA
jgi:hypothetical protein